MKEADAENPRQRAVYAIGVIAVLAIEFLLRNVFLPRDPTDAHVAVIMVAEWVLLAALLAYWMPRVEGNGLDTIGFGEFGGWHVLQPILAYFLLIAVMTLSALALHGFGLQGLRSLQPMISARSLPVRLGLLITGTFLEEVFYRGYLIERLTSLTGKRWLAGSVSWVSFTLVHLRYCGWGPTLDLGVIAAALVILYLRERSIWPSIVLHGINDLFALILIPLLMG